MASFLINEANLIDEADNIARTLVNDFGVHKPDDLKHLTAQDLKKITMKHYLKKAPAGKLTNAWKKKAGLMDEPEGEPYPRAHPGTPCPRKPRRCHYLLLARHWAWVTNVDKAQILQFV